METEKERYDKLRQTSWNCSTNSFGMAYIFDKKAQKYNYFTGLLKIFGIIVPIAVGATALGYGFNSSILKSAIALAIPLTIIQLLISVFAIVNKWDDELAYSYEASQDLALLSDSFKKIANLPPINFDEFNNQFELLNTRYKARLQQNSKHNIKEWELRMGMRYALREFQRKCVGCGNQPLSMESTDCDVCGKFDKNLIYKYFKS